MYKKLNKRWGQREFEALIIEYKQLKQKHIPYPQLIDKLASKFNRSKGSIGIRLYRFENNEPFVPGKRD